MCPHCSPQPSLLHTPTDGQSKGMLGRQEDPSQGTFLAGSGSSTDASWSSHPYQVFFHPPSFGSLNVPQVALLGIHLNRLLLPPSLAMSN